MSRSLRKVLQVENHMEKKLRAARITVDPRKKIPQNSYVLLAVVTELPMAQLPIAQFQEQNEQEGED